MKKFIITCFVVFLTFNTTVAQPDAAFLSDWKNATAIIRQVDSLAITVSKQKLRTKSGRARSKYYSRAVNVSVKEKMKYRNKHVVHSMVYKFGKDVNIYMRMIDGKPVMLRKEGKYGETIYAFSSLGDDKWQRIYLPEENSRYYQKQIITGFKP